MREHIQTQYFIYDDNNEHYLENLNVYKDLGVIFDSRLSFREHIQEKIEKAYKMLGIMVKWVKCSMLRKWQLLTNRLQKDCF